ncbi:MAG: ATP-binding protein, partial [Campylobacteraceae bacterium]|nr:ATP-binding protein [Campylobacteraceae bacterium]
MRLISEDNISNTIILTSFFIITLLMVFTGYFFISNQYKTMDLEIKDTKYRLVELRKEQVKREVDAVIDYIDFRKEHHNIESKDDLANLQKQILAWMPTIRFGTPKDNYIFAYQVYNLRGGEEFATMIVNPNRPDLVGRFISDSYTDAAGVAFRKVALEGIRESGDAFVSYLYKKPGAKELNPKITYFKIYEPWGWIIAAGAYLDDIDTLLAQKKDALIKDVRIDIISTILIFLFFSLIANSLAIVLGKQIEGFFNRYRQKVQEQTDELKEFNQTLERRVHEEAVKNKEKEQLLIHKSRFIALGEMVSNIAHQWRQPLSELSVLLMGLKLRYQT